MSFSTATTTIELERCQRRRNQLNEGHFSDPRSTRDDNPRRLEGARSPSEIQPRRQVRPRSHYTHDFALVQWQNSRFWPGRSGFEPSARSQAGHGGTGRRACPRSTWATPVRVRIPPPRPTHTTQPDESGPLGAAFIPTQCGGRSTAAPTPAEAGEGGQTWPTTTPRRLGARPRLAQLTSLARSAPSLSRRLTAWVERRSLFRPSFN